MKWSSGPLPWHGPSTQRQEFETIFAGSALTSALGMPGAISQKTEILNKDTGLVEALPLYSAHLYALPGTKLFPDSFTGREESVLEAEQASGALLGWYRNPLGSHALSVHYLHSEVSKNLYPDFLSFHDDGDDRVTVDLEDPHNHSLADLHQNGRLWLGTSVNTMATSVGPRLSSRMLGAYGWRSSSRSTDDSLEKKLAGATSKETIEQLFREVGGLTNREFPLRLVAGDYASPVGPGAALRVPAASPLPAWHGSRATVVLDGRVGSLSL